MSGGSLDYVYTRVTDAAYTIRSRSREPLHLAFADHLDKVSQALHDLEWVYSGDYGEGREEEAIRKVVTFSDEVDSAVAVANEALKALDLLIARASRIS